MHAGRSAILIRCSTAEAELIREAAKLERRTVSGFAINVILKYIANRKIEEIRPESA
jgi:uncharacterized protein (DUF1778 family)